MKVYGQLEYAQLWNSVPASVGTQLGALYLDITSPSAGIFKIYDGSAWCQVIHQTAGGVIKVPTLLYTQGSRQRNVRIKTTAGSDAMTSTDDILIVNKASGASTAVTLPSSPETGRRVTVKDGKGDANSNNITISAAAGNIDGSATLVISTAYGVKNLIYNGTQWNVI